jgi:hypothetical protein
MLSVGCGGGGRGGNDQVDSGPPWPSNPEVVLTTTFSDPTGDLEALPVGQDGPPYSGPVDFPQVDVTQVKLGVSDGHLYLRIQFSAPLPTAEVHILPAGEIEEQWVRSQGFSFSLNSDNNGATGGAGEGVSGVDLFFALGFRYSSGGSQTLAYANWSFPDGDIHHNARTVEGQLGAGGPGSDFALVRYPIATMGSYFPRGNTVAVGAWSEAESSSAGGARKYHHFAFDRVITNGTWAIP